MIHLLAIALLGQAPATPQHRLFLQPNLPQKLTHYAFFEFAPASGAGMGAECAGTTPTGAHGETMTFTRATVATCIKGDTTSIANGNMVKLTSGQPRVMRGGTGNGPLGIYVERSATNRALRSEAFDNASWTTVGVVSSAPTVTADGTIAPDGTTTADEIDSPLTGATGVSAVNQTGVGNAGTFNFSVYVRGAADAGAGTTDLCTLTNVATWSCAACAFVPTAWQRCTLGPVAVTAGGDFILGNASLYNGGTSRARSDFYAWGAQCEANNGVTSYIPTTNATVTRNTDSPQFSLAMSLPTVFISMNVLENPTLATAGNPPGMLTWRKDANNRLNLGRTAVGATIADLNFSSNLAGVTVTAVGTANNLTADGLHAQTVGGFFNGAKIGSCSAGAACDTTTTAQALASGSATLTLGRNVDTGVATGGTVFTQVCIDPTACPGIPAP